MDGVQYSQDHGEDDQDKVYDERERPPPNFLRSCEKVIPEAIIVTDDDERAEKARMMRYPDGNMMESGYDGWYVV